MSKGVTFAFTLGFLGLTLLTLIAVHRAIIWHRRERIYLERRIADLNRLYESVLRDVDKALGIIAHRAISAATGHVITTGVGLDDAALRLMELMLNGTLNGTLDPLMENATIPYWIDRMEVMANLKGYGLDLEFGSLDLKPWDSWNLILEGWMWINISDQQGVANLTRRTAIARPVSIEGFEDPLYPLNTYGRVVNVLIRTPYEGNYTRLLVVGEGANGWVYGASFVTTDQAQVDEIPNKAQTVLVVNFTIDPGTADQFAAVISEAELSTELTVPHVARASAATELVPNRTAILLDGDEGKVWHIDNLKTHVENSWYQTSTYGASFLDRLEGKLWVQERYARQTPHLIGLESFIDKNYLGLMEIPVRYNQTNIEYLYFNMSEIVGWGVKGLDPSFRIDNETSLGSTHQAIYQVTQILLD
jgi:phosphohistidine swiveling domain-containing protein